MHKPFLLFAVLAFAACTTDNSGRKSLDGLSEAKKEIALLSDSIAILRDSLDAMQQKLPIDSIEPADSTAVQKLLEKPITQKPKPIPTKTTLKTNDDGDTIYHKYNNGMVSVKITPWREGGRQVLFYSKSGKKTFSLEEVRKSYSIRVELAFADNGAVHTAYVHNSPDGSRYWYVDEIILDNDNVPITMINRRYPQELEDIMNEKWLFWNKKTQSWQREEPTE